MAEVEFRAWITIPGIDVESEHADRLHRALDQRYGDLGPVLSGATDATIVVVATDAEDEAGAAGELVHAVTDALRRARLADRYPVAVEIEPTSAPALT